MESNIKGEITADFDANDKLTDATVVYDLGDKKTAEQYCGIFKLFANEAKGIDVSCSGSKITIKGYAKMEDAEAEESDDDEKMVGRTKDAFIEAMQAEGFTCK